VVKLYIAEDDIQGVKLGQQTLVSLNSSKNQVLKATITKIYPAFDTNEQAFIAEATFIDNPGTLRNGTQLECNIMCRKKRMF